MKKIQNFSLFGNSFPPLRENLTTNTEANREESQYIKGETLFNDIL